MIFQTFLPPLLTPRSIPTIIAALILDVVGLLGLGLVVQDTFRRWPMRLKLMLVMIFLVELGQAGELVPSSVEYHWLIFNKPWSVRWYSPMAQKSWRHR